jgi:hypothetical protein
VLDGADAGAVARVLDEREAAVTAQLERPRATAERHEAERKSSSGCGRSRCSRRTS